MEPAPAPKPEGFSKLPELRPRQTVHRGSHRGSHRAREQLMESGEALRRRRFDRGVPAVKLMFAPRGRRARCL